MNWNSPAEFFAMGGYALLRLGQLRRLRLSSMVVEPILASKRQKDDSARAAPRAHRRGTRSKPMKPRHKRIALIAGGLAAIGIAVGTGAQRPRQQHRPLRHAQRGRRRQGAAGQGLPHRRPGQGRLAQARQPDRAFRHHRYRQGHSGRLHRHPSRPVQGGQGRRDPGSHWAPTASLPPAKCWPSTTKTTCRPKPRHALDQAQKAQKTTTNPMIPELGHFALILALLVAIALGVLPLLGAQRGNATWIALARPAAQAQFLLIAIAFGCLALVVHTSTISRCLRRPALELAAAGPSIASPPSGAATKARCCCGC